MISKSNPQKRARTPGEIAFDRCFLPLAIPFVLLPIITSMASALQIPTESLFTLSQVGGKSVPFALGLLFTALWARAFYSVIKGWGDPAAKVLRFVSMVLLLPFATLAYFLLKVPFQ